MVDKEVVLNIGGVLVGEELEFVENVHLVIRNGVIEHIGKGFVNNGLNYSRLIAIPPLVNSHTHTADYVMLEEGVNKSIKELVGDPNSLKYEVLSKLDEITI
ncbi:MAG: amidohydrolase, partial [Sulfolobaceae archaeon]